MKRSLAIPSPFWVFLGILCFSGGFWFAQKKISQWLSATPSVYEFSANQPVSESIKTSNVTGLIPPPLDSYEDVMQIVKNKTTSSRGVYGWYVESLTRNYAYGEDYDQAFIAASVNKIPTVIAFLLEVEKGTYALDDQYKLTTKDIEEGSGSIQYQKIGTKFSYQDLITKIGKESDNTGLNAIARITGAETIESFVHQRNMMFTNIEANTSSPQEMGKLFVDLYKNQVFKDQKYADLLLDVLTNTDFEDRISLGVPKSIRVAHKIGNQIQVWNDCGIVFADNPYVLCILTKEIAMDEAEIILPFISKTVWEFESRP